MKQLQTIAIMLCGLLLAAAAHAAQRNLTVVASATQEQKRVALVIGNAAYQGASVLRNPVNDARAMSDALNALGFQVIEVTDASQKEMNRAITAFGSKLNAETVALFFYAGHGLQVKGRNYIIPVDAQIETESAVASEAVSVDAVLEQLNASPISIVVLDACRNNPFERSFRKMGGGGLAQMDAPKGSFIAYATAPGKTAADGDGKNGLFTQELLKQIKEPGLSLESVFKRVRSSVSAKSGDAQMPWDSSSMTGEFYFKPGAGTQVASLVPVPVPARVKTKEEIEDEYWDAIKDSSDLSGFEQYRKAHPKGRYLNTANLKIAQLKKQAQQPVTPEVTGISSGNRSDPDATLWAEAQKGNTVEDYQVYVDSYPKGKYLPFAKARIKKIQDAAQAAAEQQEQQAWDTAQQENSEASFGLYLKAYPNGRFAGLAKVRYEKLKNDLAAKAEAARQAALARAEAAPPKLSLPKGYVPQGGLIWMPVTFYKPWEEANRYCATTTINGQSGWRLPTKDELSALYASGAMNGQGWALHDTWSSTPNSSGTRYYVSLSDIYVGSTYDMSSNYVTCVH